MSGSVAGYDSIPLSPSGIWCVNLTLQLCDAMRRLVASWPCASVCLWGIRVCRVCLIHLYASRVRKHPIHGWPDALCPSNSTLQSRRQTVGCATRSDLAAPRLSRLRPPPRRLRYVPHGVCGRCCRRVLSNRPAGRLTERRAPPPVCCV